MKKNILIATIFTSILLFLASCYTPSPIYGTWADNSGSKITFIDDGSFNATIVKSTGEKERTGGTWTVMENVLIFSKESGQTVNTEWDIRGSIMYLDWTTNDYDDDGNPNMQSLVLYHVSK